MRDCAQESIDMAESTMKGSDEDLKKEVNPNGTKLKLIQCVEGTPAPKCKTKKICSKGMKKIGKCIQTGTDCKAMLKWFEEGKDDSPIPESAIKCYEGCKTKAEAKGIKDWFTGMDKCMNAYYGGLVTLSSPLKVTGADDTKAAAAGGRARFLEISSTQ